MSTPTIETLQIRAIEERARLHNLTSAFVNKANELGDKLNVVKQVRRNLLAASLAAGVIGVAAGYLVAGVFIINRSE